MGFLVKKSDGKAGDRSGTIFELTDGAGTVRAEVWPMWGFNCLRWQVRQPDGRWGGIFFTSSDWEANPVPTRSGHPILFPFPGRLRDGQFDANGTTYHLPLNDSIKRNAIHGFTPRNPWRVVGERTGRDWASVTGQFQLRRDLPVAAALWPSEFALNVTYCLRVDRLQVEAVVENRGVEPLPFGLGYHPYFRLPGVSDAEVGGHILQANVAEVWEVDANNLPTGARAPVPAALDFRTPRPIGETALDHVFTGTTAKAAALVDLAVLSHPEALGRVRIRADAAFRELVLFTPQHRRAVAIEPYTCSADAANLAARSVDSGWRTLAPGQQWTGRVEYLWEAA